MAERRGLWCLHCERAWLRVARDPDEEVLLCPDPDCDGWEADLMPILGEFEPGEFIGQFEDRDRWSRLREAAEAAREYDGFLDEWGVPWDDLPLRHYLVEAEISLDGGPWELYTGQVQTAGLYPSARRAARELRHELLVTRVARSVRVRKTVVVPVS